MTDPFLHDDAPYVLGALSDQERRAFEAHLLGCAECRGRVEELRPTADLLALVPKDLVADPALVPDTLLPEALPPDALPPDTLLPGLLRRAARERRRRRYVTGAVAALAAACAVALAVVAWPGGGGSAKAPVAAARQMQPLRPNPLTVTAQLVARAWGTEIQLHCTYPSYEHDKFAYDLVVVDRHQHSHEAGDWTLVPGQDGIDFTTGTSVPRAEIRRLQVRTASGTPVLELRL
jgi:anti-sigma factor RsiW